MGHYDEMFQSHIVTIDAVTAKKVETGLYKMDMKRKWLYLYIRKRKTPIKIKATDNIREKFNSLDWLYFDKYIKDNYNLETGNQYKKKSTKSKATSKSTKKKTAPKKKVSSPKTVTYKHECANSASYHQRKYKHWAKKLTKVDTTKTTGYAFEGEWLSATSQVSVPVGAIVVEYRGCEGKQYHLYKMTETGKKELAAESSKNIVDFIKEADKALKGGK